MFQLILTVLKEIVCEIEDRLLDNFILFIFIPSG
jgi:hypothetical protein